METFKTLFDREIEAILKSRGIDPATAGESGSVTGGDTGEPFVTKTPADLAGIALSGGGIRSATFSLGLLQGLAEFGLLDVFDYLSTVSGGGYLGGFWSACRKRKVQPFDGLQGPNELPEHHAIRHLREFSRFLAPRWGVFEIETWQFFGALATAVIPALLLGVSVLALFFWMLLGLSADITGGSDSMNLAGGISDSAFAVVVVLLITVVVLATFEVETHKVESPDLAATRSYAIAAFAAIVVTVSAMAAALRGVPEWQYIALLNGWQHGRYRLFAPALAWLAAMVVLIFGRVALSRRIDAPQKGIYRAALDRVIGRLLGMATFWSVVVLYLAGSYMLWSHYQKIAAETAAAIGGAGGAIYAWVQRVMARQPTRAPSGPKSALLQRYALPLLALFALVAIAVAVGSTLFGVLLSAHSLAIVVSAVIAPALYVAIVLWLFNANEVGLHSFYRSRLARAYAGASNAATAGANRQSVERPDDDFELRDLDESRPLHLICCAANDLSGNHLANLHRGSRSATLSRFGFALADRFQDWNEAPTPVTLATAMTASGAAVNSNMGSLSAEIGAAAAFLLTMFSVRLGYWYRFLQQRERFPGLDVLAEMFSATDSGPQATAVHLSDGGHFENVALYELLRRRCKYIIVSDCGADQDVAFDDVGNALRRAREDFGVEVEIDLSVLKPNEKRFSRQHLAVGEIAYPPGQQGEPPDRGILLLFKPTLVGDEPGDVLQYRQRNHAFPHETTGNQFYDEKQWESYRRLGLHAARIAFRYLKPDQPRDANDFAGTVFGEARWEWLPVPETLQKELLARASELDDIDRQVNQSGNIALLRDLYPELPWHPGTPATESLNSRQLAQLIPLFTQVIQLMEDVYVSCQLEAYGTHPLNLGWMNIFGRWATTHAFRDWWPLLSAMYNPRMARYMEAKLGLPPVRALVGAINKNPSAAALALELWQACGRADHPGQPWTYDVTIRPGQIVSVAVVFVDVSNSPVTWLHENFFVPPSFWGARIGQQFLAEICANQKVLVSIDTDPARRKEATDAVQMYRQAGLYVAGFVSSKGTNRLRMMN
ncbi:MAG TPA: hypothetical protein VI670_03480 [Thermoanaerobaculia bacterium]|jgi:hypothetical protein